MKIVNLVLIFLTLSITSCSQENKTNHEQELGNEPLLNKAYIIAVLDTVYRAEQEPIRSRDAMMEKHGVESKQASIMLIYLK